MRFLIYAVLGIAVGAVVAGIEWVTVDQLLHRVLEAPLYVQAGAPVLGLVLSALILRVGWRTDPATSDIYVQAFHGEMEIEHRRLFPKLAAAIATAGLGGAVGLEGPSIYAGSTIGQWMAKRPITVLGTRSRRVLLAAGAAAGVAAIFKAPATGVLFALEAPYRRDVARQALVPALIASAAAYITFVLILGSDRLLLIGPAEFSLTHGVLGAVVLGLFAGVAARGLALLFHHAKDITHTAPLRTRLPLAATAIVVAAISSHELVGRAVTLGPGADTIVEIVLDPTVSVWTIIALFGLRAVATSAAFSAGGVGGVFIPLVVQGLLLGRVVEFMFDAPSNGLFPVVGLAAVLGAGYRTPLAAVMFVAETTGRAEFVIPALLATAISQSLMGEVSVSVGQVDERKGQLERRLSMPASALTIPFSGQISPDEPLLQVVDDLDEDSGLLVLPVFEDGYRGLLVLSDISSSILEHGMEAPVRTAMRDVPAITADTPSLEAARLMNEYNSAAVAVLDDEGVPIGIITSASLAGVDDLI